MEQNGSMVWQPGSIAELPPEGTVHIWRSQLNQPPQIVQQLAQTLSPDEIERVKRFKFHQHQQRSLVSRGILRAILGRYLQIDPGTLKFTYETHGKPALAPASNRPDLQFNLAHSENLVVYAIALNAQVGIDVEYQRSTVSITEIAHRFFSTAEQQALQRLSGEAQRAAFFQYWTAKEAVLKATGQGLGGLATVEVSLPECSLTIQGELAYSYPSHSWTIHLFEPEQDYNGAIAIPWPRTKFLFFEW